MWLRAALCVAALTAAPQPAAAQGDVRATGQRPQAAAASAGAAALAPDYVIGADDVLDVMFWKDKDMSAQVVVRPDGKISLPLLNDVQAAGLTPDQLRARITEDGRRFIESPSVTVVVKAINSRRVFITGEVQKPGTYALTARTTVLQLIAMAGGLNEYTRGEKILIMREESGRQLSLRFDYRQVAAGKNLKQNIELKPGDTVIVP